MVQKAMGTALFFSPAFLWLFFAFLLLLFSFSSLFSSKKSRGKV